MMVRGINSSRRFNDYCPKIRIVNEFGKVEEHKMVIKISIISINNNKLCRKRN